MKGAVQQVGITVAAFARMAGVPDRTLRSWLAGTRDPSNEALEKVAAGLDAFAASTHDLANLARQLRADSLDP